MLRLAKMILLTNNVAFMSFIHSIKAMLLLIDCKDEVSTSKKWTRNVVNNGNEDDSALKMKPAEVTYGDLG